MKKTLIALAALGMMAGAAQASDVTIYGQLQPSYDFMTVKNGGSDVDYTNMNDNASRLGFKGSEDLGNGLQAVFKLESYFNIVDGDGFNGSRDAWVGLKGDFGTIMFGKIDTVYKSISGKYDSFSDTIGDYNSIMSVSQGGQDVNKRDSKTAKYVSPDMNGFKVMANYTLDGDADETTGAWGIGATYDNGPLNVLAAYTKRNNDYVGDDVKFWKIGAAYKVDAFKLKAIYENAKVEDESNKNIFLGVDFALNGNTTLMADFIKAGDYIDNDGAKAWNIGVNYKLSKRTSVQGMYAYLKNDDGGDYANDAGYGDSDSGAKISGFSVRLQHKF